MREPIKALEEYRKFLETIPLNRYREEFKLIKWVEQDLHPLLFPLESIFENYWEKQNYLSFEEWFEKFWKGLQKKEEKKEKLNDLKELVKAHRKFYEDLVNNNLEDKLFRGFKARMYRTWISVLTQLDFCYMFQYICAKEGMNLRLECNAELDARGIDAQVNEIGFQIAKISQRKVAQKILRKTKVILIPYILGWEIDEAQDKLKKSRTRNKERYQKQILAFEKYLLKLPNGFVVFKEDYLKSIIEQINDIEKVRSVVSKIFLELTGTD